MADSRAKFIFSVQTLEAKPNLVLLARAIASLGVRNVNTVSTGPNILSEQDRGQRETNRERETTRERDKKRDGQKELNSVWRNNYLTN